MGTAQFDSVYGISNNKKKKLEFSEVKRILKKSKLFGIKYLDTAISYDNDKILGKAGVKGFYINTKIPIYKLNKNKKIKKFYENKIKTSLNNLKIKKFNSILIHNPEKLKSENGKYIYKILKGLKKQKLFNKIGISIYNFNDFNKLFKHFKFDIIQLPFNVFDQRLLKNNLIEKLNKKKIEIHVRSIFLQGLLLMNDEKIDKKFKKWKDIFKIWSKYTQNNKLIKLKTCVNFVKSYSKISKILIGVNSVNDLVEINKIKFKKTELPYFNFYKDKKLINPTYWKDLH